MPMMSPLFGLDMIGLMPNTLQSAYKSQAQIENNICFYELFNRYSNLAITRYQWEGLPNSVSERYLNTALYLYGQAAFFFDDAMGWMALPCTVAGEYNAYYEPLRVNAFSFNYSRFLRAEDFVYIRNNPSCTPTAYLVFEYTRRMADVLRTIDVLTRKMKQPYMILCDEKEKLTIENTFKKVLDNEQLVIGSKNFNLEQKMFDLKNLELRADIPALWDSYHTLQSTLCAGLGIETTGQEKRERLLNDEVNANNMFTAMSIEVNIKELEHACEEINRKFGLNISVSAKDIYDYRREEQIRGSVYNGTEETG